MSLPQDCDSFDELCCDQCHFKSFPSEFDFNLHNLAHKSEPVVSLVRLSEYSLEKLKHHSYKVNNGVARRTRNLVSPLRISLKKQQGSVEFHVVRVQKSNDRKVEHGKQGESKKANEFLGTDSTGLGVDGGINAAKKEVEGSRFLERFGANISVTRKSNALPVQQFKETGKELDDNDNVNKKVSCGLSQNQILDHLLIGGVSVIKQNPTLLKSDSSKEDAKLPKIANIFGAAAEDENNLKKGTTTTNTDTDKQNFNKTTILRKLSGLGFSLIPKTSDGADSDERSTANDSAEKENKLQKINSDLEIFVRPKNCSENVTSSEDKSDSLYVVEITNKKVSADNRSTVEKAPVKIVANSPEEIIASSTSKKQVRVKNSNVNKRGIETDKIAETREVDSVRLDSNVNDYKRIACDSSLGVHDSAKDRLKSFSVLNATTKSDSKGRESATKMGVNSSPTEQLQPDFIAPRLERVTSPLTRSESQFKSTDEQNNRLQDSNDCSVLLSPVQEGENGESSTFNSVSCDDGFRSEPFAGGNNEAEDQGNEVAVSYSSLPNEDQSLDQPQQDPLMASEPAASNEESLNQNFLHTFLNETQTSQPNMQPEGSEYMSLERLGQVSGLESQHGQANFDVSTSEPSTPMEQLSQQVQRLPNPQINVIPHHHMQAPQPPQLHPGLPQIPPQQSNSFDALSHIQPPMPPPLYQGYNMYNQNFSSQGPQQLPPRPPMLQQRPPIQTRGFPNIVPPPRTRHRSYATKRNSARMPGPQEVPTKQRRIDPPVPARSQPSVSPTTKIPSGITVTPSKKNLEASKVANVLASRGITVTPSSAVPRQTSPSNRSHQRNPNPIINIGPGVSITTNSSSRAGGNFAVPGSRRNSPIVNPDVERPERCATVDLTQDDDPLPPSHTSRLSGTRFPCNQCSKVFPTSAALETHKSSHRTVGALPFKCDKCSAHYPNAAGLQQHRAIFHKAKQVAPDLAIPIVDLNHPGAREQLAKCGVHGFLPLAQLQSNSLGYFGVPIINLDSTKEKAVPSVNVFGAANVLVLGKMKTLSQPQIR